MGLPWMLVPGTPWEGCTTSQITVPWSMWVSQSRLLKSTMPWAFSTIWGVPTVRGKCSMVLPSSPRTGGLQAASFCSVKAPSGVARRFTASWSMPKVTFLSSRVDSTVSQVTGSPSPRAGRTKPQAALQSGAQNTSTWPLRGGIGTCSSWAAGAVSGLPSCWRCCSLRRCSTFIIASRACLWYSFITAAALASAWENTCLRKAVSGCSPVQKSSTTSRSSSFPCSWQKRI